MAVQWDKENGLNGWGVDFWNTIRGIKKDLPEVDAEIKKFIENKSELFKGINAQDIELLRPDTIQSVEELSGVTDELREDFVDFLGTADSSGDIMKQYQNHLAKSAEKTSSFSSFTTKAGGVALKGLALAGNVLSGILIAKGIELTIKRIDVVNI